MTPKDSNHPRVGLLLRRLHARSGEHRSGRAKLAGNVLPSHAVSEGNQTYGHNPMSGAAGRTAVWPGGAYRKNAWSTAGTDGSTLRRGTPLCLVGGRAIPDREEALEILYASLMDYVNAGLGTAHSALPRRQQPILVHVAPVRSGRMPMPSAPSAR